MNPFTNRLRRAGACLALLLGAAAATAQPAARPRKALFVIVDGIAADQLRRVPTPELDALGHFALAYVGGQPHTYTQTPTISAVGYNSLLTGTWVNKHNVWGNDIREPNYHYHSIFRFFQQQRPGGTTAVFSSWLDNRTRLLGDNLPQTGPQRLTYHFDGLELDTLGFPHDTARRFMHLIDEHVTDAAAACLRQQAPDLTWVYLEYPDDMGHRHGDALPFYQAIALMDRQIGRLRAAIAYREKTFGEDWLLLVTTDHGRDPRRGMNHGGQSARERSTWVAAHATGLNAHFARDTVAIVDLLPTLARHLGLHLPQAQAWEIDGVPLIGPVSVSHAEAERTGNALAVRWRVHDTAGQLRIWLTTTNHFETGGRDLYRLLGQWPVAAGQARLEGLPPGFYKIVIEAPHNSLNRWVVE